MISTLKLIRFSNLLLIAFTLFSMRYGILQPILTANGLGLELSNVYFLFLVASVVLIAAGGYMINDYFDVDTDSINRLDKVLIGKFFTPNAVFNTYIVVNIVALSLSFYVSFRLNLFSLFTIFPITAGALWFYSTTYKRQFLIGNILISFFVAMVPMIPAFYEVPVVYSKYKALIVLEGLDLKFTYAWTGVFAIFAFFVNLVREIAKDLEDLAGDKLTGCKTVPIVLGIKVTKVIIIFLDVVILLLVAFIYIFFLLFNETSSIDYVTMGYFLSFLILPLILSGFYVVKAKDKRNYSKVSAFLKIVLLFGIIYAWFLRNKVI